MGGDDYEIIIVDDGSTDESAKIIDGFSLNEKIKVIHKKNGGVSSARNTGLGIATGEYITFVDADDEVIKGTLTKVMGYLDGQNDICIASAIQDGQNPDTRIFEKMEFRGKMRELHCHLF